MKKLAILLAFALSLTLVCGCTSAPVSSAAPSVAPSAPAESAVKNDVPVADIEAAVKKAYGENYIPSMVYTDEEFTQKFAISKDLYDEAIAVGPMISVHIDTFVAIKAKEGKVEDVQKALAEYLKVLQEDSVQYPMNLPKVQAARISTYGNYAFFIMLGVPDDTLTEEAAVLEHFQKQNDIGEDVIKEMLGVK